MNQVGHGIFETFFALKNPRAGAQEDQRTPPRSRQPTPHMSIHVALHHQTHYRYDRPVDAGTANRAPAAGAALPHAHPELLAPRRAGKAFP